MPTKRVHILSAVNAANVSKAGDLYTVRDVCGAVDDIVMNGMLYPADQLASGVATLNGKPAPAGHPKNDAGQFISASHGEAMLTAYMGAVCRNARHEGGRTLTDIVVNAKMAKAHDAGVKLLERLDAAIAATNSEPIHVSTGLLVEPITANGESRGKRYQRIATNLRYDHLAILLNEQGAGTPEDGVGMFLNAAGAPEPVEAVVVNTDPVDQRSAGLIGWIKRLVGNGTDVSFDAITSSLYAQMPDGCWIRDVFDRYAIWSDRDGALWRQDYSVASDGSVAFSGQAEKVRREVTYESITNSQKVDNVKEQILAALNAAGIAVVGKTDAQLLQDYDAVKAKPHTDAVTAANSKVATLELAANAAADAELNTVAGELAANSKQLTLADFKAMGLERCRELKASAKAAPIVVGNSQSGNADEFAGYDLNKVEGAQA